MADRSGASRSESGTHEAPVSDHASLKSEVLGLLLEPLGVDVTVGLEALEELARDVAVVAERFEVASVPPSGTTLPWISAAVVACLENDELVAIAAAEGWSITSDEVRAVRALARVECLEQHLPGLQGVTVEALRADLGAVSLAERVLPGVLERCRRANHAWPKDIRRSIRQVDVDDLIAGLRRRRGSRQASDARELVGRHAASTVAGLSTRDLIARLETVREFLAAKDSYDALLSKQPDWWRWLGPAVRFRFRSDRLDALVWAIETRDTGAVSAGTLEVLADDTARVVIERWLATSVHTARGLSSPQPMSSAERLSEGLFAVASRAHPNALRAVESWFGNDIEMLDRVAAAMDAQRTDPVLGAALDGVVAELTLPFGPADVTRSAYRDIQSAVRSETAARLPHMRYSAHAVENAYLVGIVGSMAAVERELRDAVRTMPTPRGNLVVAIAGRTKSGKTTLRKALTREADRSGIGRGAHRTTRQTSAFALGAVTYLDTPGVAAKDDDFDAYHARAAWDLADAVIWNYADTLRDEEVVELGRLFRSGKPLLAVVNVKERVDTPERLELFVERPERAFASSAGHIARIEQVSTAFDVEPPTVLVVHSGAAHESLSAESTELAERAFEASRLEDLEAALVRLLAERAVPLRAVRLADGVRVPLSAVNGRLAEELPQIELALTALEGLAPAQRRDLEEAIRIAGRGARDRLDARRQVARDRLSAAIPNLGGADHAERWGAFLDGLELEDLALSLEAEFEQEISSRGRIMRGRAESDERHDGEHLRVERRPDASVWDRIAAAAEGAGSNLLSSLALRGLAKKLGAGAAGGPGGSFAVVVSQIAEVVAAAAKAVSQDVDRSRQAMQQWKGDTVVTAETELDDLFAKVDAQLARIVEDTITRVGAQFEQEWTDIQRTRERLAHLRQLNTTVESALDKIDLVLARRLLDLAGGDPAVISAARRAPGELLRVFTDPARAEGVQASLNAQFVHVLTEKIEVCSGRIDDLATGAASACDGNADD